MNEPFLTAFPALCEHCEKPYEVSDEVLEGYLTGAHHACGQCGNSTSLYLAVLRTLRSPMTPFATIAAQLIGARSLVFKFELTKNKTSLVDLTAYGVEDGSTILTQYYTPEGPIFPAEMTGSSRLTRQALKYHVYGASFGPTDDDTSSESCLVTVLITFIPPQRDEAAIYSFSKAYSHYLAESWGQMAIAAVTGVEFSLKQAMQDFVPKWAKTGVKDKAYLQEIYPDYCRQHGCPVPEKDLIDSVSRLWGVRDKYAHSGALMPGYDKESAVKQICSALFLYCHIRRHSPLLTT